MDPDSPASSIPQCTSSQCSLSSLSVGYPAFPPPVPQPQANSVPLSPYAPTLKNVTGIEDVKMKQHISDKRNFREDGSPYNFVQEQSPRHSPQHSSEVVVSLMDKELWKSFHEIGNEMIVTKPGR